jgi:hypothetical protein
LSFPNKEIYFFNLSMYNTDIAIQRERTEATKADCIEHTVPIKSKIESPKEEFSAQNAANDAGNSSEDQSSAGYSRSTPVSKRISLALDAIAESNSNSITDTFVNISTSRNARSKSSTPMNTHPKRKSISRKEEASKKPRWWTQNYLLFLAMRTSDKPLTRKELIPRALALDKKIAKERNLPTLFHGKTPQNTASGRLTTNFDKTFISFIPEGEKKIHFKLSYEPGCFKSAFAKYEEWTKILIEKDWPYFFKGQFEDVMESDFELQLERSGQQNSVEGEIGTLKVDAGEQSMKAVDEIEAKIDGSVDEIEGKFNGSVDGIEARNEGSVDRNENDIQVDLFEQSAEPIELSEEENIKNGPTLYNPKLYSVQVLINTPKTQPKKPFKHHDYQIPTTLAELLEKRESTIPNAGQGLFALMPIPKHTYLGFYFGVPMSEDEFDVIKSLKGVANSYCFRYKNTVLDATDEEGVLYDIDCPFFFINEGKFNVEFLEGRLVNQVICCTTRVIEQGEELFVDYGVDFMRPWLE